MTRNLAAHGWAWRMRPSLIFVNGMTATAAGSRPGVAQCVNNGARCVSLFIVFYVPSESAVDFAG
jgi:hypothetical protein